MTFVVDRLVAAYRDGSREDRDRMRAVVAVTAAWESTPGLVAGTLARFDGVEREEHDD